MCQNFHCDGYTTFCLSVCGWPLGCFCLLAPMNRCCYEQVWAEMIIFELGRFGAYLLYWKKIRSIVLSYLLAFFTLGNEYSENLPNQPVVKKSGEEIISRIRWSAEINRCVQQLGCFKYTEIWLSWTSCSNLVVVRWGGFGPAGAFATFWRGGEGVYYCHLVVGVQGCCYTSHNAQESPPR